MTATVTYLEPRRFARAAATSLGIDQAALEVGTDTLHMLAETMIRLHPDVPLDCNLVADWLFDVLAPMPDRFDHEVQR